jgi:O-methyltransferase involved in polyketide biosynthesis
VKATRPRHPIQLGHIQETMLIPLYARAAECRRKNPILRANP